MTDNLTTEQRSYSMSRIRSTKTRPETAIRPLMKKLGFTYQPKGIKGRPDFLNKENKTIVFIDGCFWHGCRLHYIQPKTNVKYWKHKIETNVERDREVDRNLRSDGWKVIRIWEHQIIGVR